MRCKTCDYRLWNLKARQCPECGTPFRVSDFEFVPNSVQFCCPDCGQAYYGTGYKGHLMPEAFLCVKCGRSLHMNDMVLLPTDGVEEEQTEPFHMPWLERTGNGWWRSWWSTVKMSLFSPAQLMRSLPPKSPVASAWWFALATYLIITGIVAGLIGGVAWIAGGGRAVAGPIVFAAVFALLALVLVAAWAALAHLVLKVTGQTEYGFGRTCEALCYSTGTNVLLLVPLCGVYIHWIWWLVNAILMLKERQRVHGGRATLALLPLPILLVVGLPLTMIWIGSRSATFTATAPWPPAPASLPTPGAMTPPQSQTLSVAIRLNQYALANAGRGPRHIVELLGPGLPPQSLLLPGTATVPADIPIGDLTLNSFGGPLPDSQRTDAVETLIDSLPKDIVAYRLGDFVFTYPGVDFHRANRGLWTVIAWPDPDANPNFAPAEVTVGLLDGTPATFPAILWKSELAAQNDLRARSGLPPLPQPATVRHVHPAGVPAEQEP